MKKGQASIEVIMIAVLVIALSTIIVSRALATHNEIFPTATARQAAIGKIGELETNYSLDFVSSINCGSEIRVWAYIHPNPGIYESEIVSAMQTATENVSGSKPVLVIINPPTTPICT